MGVIGAGITKPLSSLLGPLLLTWINFKPDMDKYPHAQSSVGVKLLIHT